MGVVSDVLSDIPAEVEVIDINKDYRDSDSLRSYADKLFTNPELHPCGFTVANFEDDEGLL